MGAGCWFRWRVGGEVKGWMLWLWGELGGDGVGQSFCSGGGEAGEKDVECKNKDCFLS